MKIKFKEGVVLKELNDPLLKMLEGIDKVFLQMGHVPTITSVNDGKHMVGSMHYINKAIDLRVKDLPLEQWAVVANRIKSILGPEFDVILEKDHIHVELDT